MPSLPITIQNVREWFPAPRTENPFVGDPWWQVQCVGLLAAIQLLRLLPDDMARQQALVELRRAIDTGLLSVPAPADEDVQRRLAQTLAPWCPTPFPIVDAMLSLAALRPDDDVLYDLGSGDGRIVLEAAKQGARAVGIEIDAILVGQSNERRDEDPAYELAEFRHENVMEADFSAATVVTCYLVSSSMAALSTKFRTLRPGTRIISHAFAIPDWEPKRVRLVGESLLYLWVV